MLSLVDTEISLNHGYEYRMKYFIIAIPTLD